MLKRRSYRTKISPLAWMRSLALLALSFQLSAFSPVSAQEPTSVEEVLAAVKEAGESVESWSADVEMTMSLAALGGEMKQSGTLQTKGTRLRGNMKIALSGQTMNMAMVIDGDGMMWMEMSMGDQIMTVMKMDAGAMQDQVAGLAGVAGSDPFSNSMSQNPIKTLEMLQEMYELKFIGTETLDGNEVYVLEGKGGEKLKMMMDAIGADASAQMAQMGLSMEQIRVKVGKADGFPRELTYFDDEGSPSMKMSYRNVRLNIDLDDSLFVYTPPEGVAVIDLTEMIGDALGDLGDSPDEGASLDQREFNNKFQVGDVAPDFEGPAFPVGSIKLADYRGKVVLLDFWATWCGPCIAELPNVIDVYKEYHPQGLEIVGISLDRSERELERFLKENPGMSWSQVYDGKYWDAEVGVLYGVDAIPYALLLDGTGTIRYRDLRRDDLGKAVAQLLAEASK